MPHDPDHPSTRLYLHQPEPRLTRTRFDPSSNPPPATSRLVALARVVSVAGRVAVVVLLVMCLDAAWHRDMVAAAWRWAGAVTCLVAARVAARVVAILGDVQGEKVGGWDEDDVDL